VQVNTVNPTAHQTATAQFALIEANLFIMQGVWVLIYDVRPVCVIMLSSAAAYRTFINLSTFYYDDRQTQIILHDASGLLLLLKIVHEPGTLTVSRCDVMVANITFL